ncbi:hypothetical protein HZS_6691 [Henneguya salminicola]|nr:hypothetical protein HZS_6691 [Henneguya salminicola]
MGTRIPISVLFAKTLHSLECLLEISPTKNDSGRLDKIENVFLDTNLFTCPQNYLIVAKNPSLLFTEYNSHGKQAALV